MTPCLCERECGCDYQRDPSAIGKFISGGSQNILDGVGALLGTGINTLLGSGMGAQGQREDYFIALEGFAIVRLECKIMVP